MEEKMPQVEMVNVAHLMLSHKNPRNIKEDRLDSLKKSIAADPTFLQSRPVLANRINGNLVVYAGQQRLLACRSLGMTEVPCIIQDNIPLDVLEYRMLLDNVHQGDWNNERLHAEFSEELNGIVWGKDFNPDSADVDTSSERKNDIISQRLVFNDKDDVNRMYLFLEDLKTKYPEDSVTQRILKWLLDESK